MSIFVVLFLCACIVAKMGYDMAFQRAGPEPDTPYTEAAYYDTIHLRYADVNQEDYPRRAIAFSSGSNTLRGYVYGEANSKGLVVISHGLGSGSEGYFAETLFFIDQGWRVLAFDNTGSYRSDGARTRGISQSLLDLNAAFDFIAGEDSLKNMPVFLFGHSWGGYATTAILNWHPEVKAVASMSGFASPREALFDFAENKTSIFGILGFPFFWGYHCLLFQDNANISAIEGINSSGVPVLLIHGTEDKTLRYDWCGIISHQDAITNPRVQYISRSIPGQNGHSDLMCSQQAIAYQQEKKAEWAALQEKYDHAIPADVKAQYYAGLDKALASQLDPELFAEINRFFEKELP